MSFIETLFYAIRIRSVSEAGKHLLYQANFDYGCKKLAFWQSIITFVQAQSHVAPIRKSQFPYYCYKNIYVNWNNYINRDKHWLEINFVRLLFISGHCTNSEFDITNMSCCPSQRYMMSAYILANKSMSFFRGSGLIRYRIRLLK